MRGTFLESVGTPEVLRLLKRPRIFRLASLMVYPVNRRSCLEVRDFVCYVLCPVEDSSLIVWPRLMRG